MAVALGWFVLAIFVGAIATNRRRSGFAWFMVSLIFSPLIGLLALLAAGKGGKECPACREPIDPLATVCPHCRTPLASAAPEPKPGQPPALAAKPGNNGPNVYVIDEPGRGR